MGNQNLTQLVEIDQKNNVSISNQAIEKKILESYGVYGMKIVMIGIVGAYAIGKKHYDHRFFIKFSVENFARLIKQEERYAISIFKKACDDLRKKEVAIDGTLDDQPSTFLTGVLDTYAYTNNERTLALKFNEAFVPIFMQMSGNFTQYALNYALSLNKVESINFYCFLKMKIGKDLPKIVKSKKYMLEIEEEKLRIFFNIFEKYKQSRDFKNKILVPIADEISKNTDINLSFETTPRSKVITIHFSLKEDSDLPSNVSIDDFKISKPNYRLTKDKKTKDIQKEKKESDSMGIMGGQFWSTAPDPKEKETYNTENNIIDLESLADKFFLENPTICAKITEMFEVSKLKFLDCTNSKAFILYLIKTFHERNKNTNDLSSFLKDTLSNNLQEFYTKNKDKEKLSFPAIQAIIKN